MDALWSSLVAWLHSVGLPAGAGVADAVGAGAAQAASGLDMPSLLALAAALGWVSGFRLYAVVFLVGASGALGWMPLPEGLQVLQHPALLATSGALLFVEFFADKIPGLDSLWDMVNSVIRTPGMARSNPNADTLGTSGSGAPVAARANPLNTVARNGPSSRASRTEMRTTVRRVAKMRPRMSSSVCSCSRVNPST